MVFGLLREPLSDLIRELNLCFSYVMQNFPDVSVSRLLLAGGGANLRGLAESIEQQLGVTVAPLGTAPDAAAHWEHPLPGPALQPEVAAAMGGAMLDVESR